MPDTRIRAALGEGPTEPDGPRRGALDARRRIRKRRLRATAIGVAAAVAGAAIGVGIALFLRSPEGAPPAAPEGAAEADGALSTTLLFGTVRPPDESEKEVVWLTLLALDDATGKASVVFVPPHTAAEVPGRGLLGLGESLSSGGVPLLVAAADALLGIDSDRYLEIASDEAPALLDDVGPLTLNVPADVRVSEGGDLTRLLLQQGTQELGGASLTDLLYVRSVDGDDVELGQRHVAFWDALLDAYAAQPALLGQAAGVSEALSDGSDTPAVEHARFLEQLASVPEDDRTVAVLPVDQVSVGDDELYEADRENIVSWLEATVGVERESATEVRVQVLNGNGEPGIGEVVAQRLGGKGFRVVLTGNARRLDYSTTQIVTYDSSPQGLDAARRAESLLGTGKVRVGLQEQGIVDLTIVVGKDFLRGP